jgi:hypothetical protein
MCTPTGMSNIKIKQQVFGHFIFAEGTVAGAIALSDIDHPF